MLLLPKESHSPETTFAGKDSSSDCNERWSKSDSEIHRKEIHCCQAKRKEDMLKTITENVLSKIKRSSFTFEVTEQLPQHERNS